MTAPKSMHYIACVLLALLCQVAQAGEKVRTWTDVQGRQMQAQFLREVDGDVSFLRDGKLVTVPLNRLSDADQKLIRELEAAKVVEADVAPAGAPRPQLPSDADAASSPARLDGDGNKPKVPTSRTWRDVSGKQTTGTFVRIFEGKVVLSRAGRVLSLPYSTLSPEDKDYVRDLLTARGEEASIPQPPATAPDPQRAEPAPAAVQSGVGEERIPETSPFQPQLPPQPTVSGPTVADEPRATVPPPDFSPPPAASFAAPPLPGPQLLPSPPQLELPPAVTSPTQPPASPRISTRRVKFDSAQKIIQFCIALPIVAAILSLILAIILRAAAYFVTGGHIPYGDAYGTAFLMYLASGALGFLFSIVTTNLDDETFNTLSLVTVPISFVVQSVIIAGRHELSFGEACLVTLAMIFIIVAIIVVLVGIGFAVLVGLRGS